MQPYFETRGAFDDKPFNTPPWKWFAFKDYIMMIELTMYFVYNFKSKFFSL